MDVWYASYGSNMCADRLACYLTGGCPPGAAGPTPAPGTGPCPRICGPSSSMGASTSPGTPPRGTAGSRSTTLKVRVRPSAAPTGSRRVSSPTCWSRRCTGSRVPTTTSASCSRRACRPGDGRYESLHVVGELEGEPVVTFTSPERMHAADRSQPSATYLATMARGPHGGHGWDGDRVAAYLLERPGIGAWAAAGIQRPRRVIRLRGGAGLPDPGHSHRSHRCPTRGVRHVYDCPWPVRRPIPLTLEHPHR